MVKLPGTVDDLFSHMELLGLARILEQSDTVKGPVLLGWESPETMTIDTADGNLDSTLLAVSVRQFIELTASQREILGQEIQISGKLHSPLSPRVAHAFTPEEWTEYFRCRQHIVDRIEPENPLMASLVGCLGSPSYWTRLTGTKEEQKVDQGASRWEMAPRNSGSEFFRSKYEKLLGYIESLEVQEIIDRILRKYLKNNGENENACGLRPTAPADSLLSWICYQGISCFPTRPIASGRSGRDSASTGVLEPAKGQHERVAFVLPIFSRPITIDRYLCVCRYAGLYEITGAMRHGENHISPDLVLKKRWLTDHQVEGIAWFARNVGGTKNCPKYWALPGNIIELESTAEMP